MQGPMCRGEPRLPDREDRDVRALRSPERHLHWADQTASGYIGDSDGVFLFLDKIQTLTVDGQQRLVRQEIVKLQLPGPTIIKTIVPPTPMRRIISP